MGFPQVEIDGDFFSISRADCRSVAMGQEVTTFLIAGHGYVISAGFAIAGKDDCYLHERSGQQHSLQLTRLLPAKCSGIPKIHGSGNCSHARHLLLRACSTATQYKKPDGDQ
ncbi:MAG: hypothetical protein BGO25_15710 [Acidobacteriales bacterium 59-55]|nr:MAG: hypothetical protein BGO25_15710 [Acidobacteriales bacterium 59-55]